MPCAKVRRGAEEASRSAFSTAGGAYFATPTAAAMGALTTAWIDWAGSSHSASTSRDAPGYRWS